VLGGQNSVNLAAVYQIVGSKETEQVLDALAPSFGVKSYALRLLRSETGPQVEIGLSQTPELTQRQRERNLIIAELVRPLILVVSRERGPVLGEDHPDPVPHHQVAIGQMLNDLEHRPFARCLRPPHGGVIPAPDTVVQPGHQLRHDRERIPRTEHLKQRSHIGRSRGGSVGRRVRERHQIPPVI
jgi:hypothetical protein